MTKKRANDDTSLIEVPIAPYPIGYEVRHVEVRLTHGQRATMNRVLRQLNAEHAQLASGKHVESAAEAMRYILELIGGANPGQEAPPETVPEVVKPETPPVGVNPNIWVAGRLRDVLPDANEEEITKTAEEILATMARIGGGFTEAARLCVTIRSSDPPAY